MHTTEKQHVVVILLGRAGGLLAATAVVLGIASLVLENGGSVTFSHRNLPSARPRPGEALQASNTSSDAVVDAKVQVAVAEIHSLTAEDWERFLSRLSTDLHLGLSIEAQLQATTSEFGPPADPLNRLMWATQLLQTWGIELRVEQGTIRALPTSLPPQLPLEACNGGDFEVSPVGTAGNAMIASFSGDESRTILHHVRTGSFATPTRPLAPESWPLA